MTTHLSRPSVPGAEGHREAGDKAEAKRMAGKTKNDLRREIAEMAAWLKKTPGGRGTDNATEPPRSAGAHCHGMSFSGR